MVQVQLREYIKLPLRVGTWRQGQWNFYTLIEVMHSYYMYA